MKKWLTIYSLLLTFLFGEEIYAKKITVPKLPNNQQLILVTKEEKSINKVTIQTFEKVSGSWKQIHNFTGFVGRNGLTANKKEGDKKSPIGTFKIGTAFGVYNNPGTKLPYRKTSDDDVWVDDPKSLLYNTWQSKRLTKSKWKSAEQMKIPAYNYGFVIEYNTEKRIPYKGSGIFFHVSKSPTAGCVGTSQKNVVAVLKWLDLNKNPVIVLQN